VDFRKNVDHLCINTLLIIFWIHDLLSPFCTKNNEIGSKFDYQLRHLFISSSNTMPESLMYLRGLNIWNIFLKVIHTSLTFFLLKSIHPKMQPFSERWLSYLFFLQRRPFVFRITNIQTDQNWNIVNFPDRNTPLAPFLLQFINWWFVQVGKTQKNGAFLREVKSYFCIWQDRIILFSSANLSSPE